MRGPLRTAGGPAVAGAGGPADAGRAAGRAGAGAPDRGAGGAAGGAADAVGAGAPGAMVERPAVGGDGGGEGGRVRVLGGVGGSSLKIGRARRSLDAQKALGTRQPPVRGG